MKPSLVILAAGIGSRYGGIKQLDGFGPHGERIIDYTVFDAIQAGYGKIIFIIRKEIEEDFNELIITRWKDKVDLHVVFQELDSLPKGYSLPPSRVKPWGTAHAVWMTEGIVQEPFAIVNADDFYGRESLKGAADYLKSLNPEDLGACLVGYQVKNTLTDFGTVSRGICEADENGMLTEIIERTKISREAGGKIYFEEEDEKTYIEEDTLVSMNLMGFSPRVFDQIREGFDAVYKESLTNPKKEYYIPTVLNEWIKSGVKVPVISTKDQWFGVTYKEDKPWVKEQFKKLHDSSQYPVDLWG